ncbi:unnamed protein product [Mycena citricolor]|uniref:Mannitol-1-phosphate 5-dehydrogenase n=1 Tax=Mycena citricolor TaxID=2018698 RepID=A0AAD2HXX4_9AGAR|nr:unnamed protein product [Mycena citricolor]
MSTKPRAIHFGAGNIGRGFIAPLLYSSGYHVVFADVDKKLIDTINDKRSYGVHILDTNLDDGEKVEEVGHVKGVLSNTDDILRELLHPKLRLITTAVGLPILDKVAPTLAKGFSERRAKGVPGTINVIACENTIGGTAQLAEKIRNHLDAEDLDFLAQHVGFSNCSVDRIVPPFDPDEHDGASKLNVGVEEFFEWVVEGPALHGGKLEPPVEGMTLTENLKPYNERKLFTLNAGHAITAYLGFLKGLPTIDASISDPAIRDVVSAALRDEAGAALCKRHGFEPAQHAEYVEKIISRFSNAAVKDDVARVGRQPLRKLGREDRLVGPTRLCSEYGIPAPNLAKGIAAALLYENKDDEQSIEMRKTLSEKGLDEYVTELTGFKQGHDAHKLICEAYSHLEKSKSH